MFEPLVIRKRNPPGVTISIGSSLKLAVNGSRGTSSTKVTGTNAGLGRAAFGSFTRELSCLRQ